MKHVSEGEGIFLKLINDLKKDKKITMLDLSSNTFDKKEQEALVGLFEGKNSIQNISLARCNLSDEVFADCFKALSKNTKIQLFDARVQYINTANSFCYKKTGKEIASCIEKNAVLKLLHIEGNVFEDEMVYVTETVCTPSLQ